MKNFMLLLLACYALAVCAQQKTPAYELLKPYFSSGAPQTVLVGLSSDSLPLLQSILFTITSEKKESKVQLETLPCIVMPFKDSLYYIHQRIISYNQSFLEEYDTTVTINYYGYESYPVVCRKLSDVYKESAYDRIHQEKPADIEPSIHAWDETFITCIDYILPEMVQLNTYYEGYTGGAHPNHYNTTEIVSVKSFLQNERDDEGRYSIAEDGFNFLEQLKPNNLDSVKRVLYFKGVANCFDDFDEGDDCENFDVNKYNGIEIGTIDTAEYTVDLSVLNPILKRTANAYDVYIEAFADAPYAMSGDYSFTASCRQGRLPQSYFLYTHQTLNLALLQTIDKDVVDFYTTADKSALLLVRQTTEGTQIRLVFNEGKNYVSHPIAAGWHIIQFSVLQNAMAQRLANEMQTTAK